MSGSSQTSLGAVRQFISNAVGLFVSSFNGGQPYEAFLDGGPDDLAGELVSSSNGESGQSNQESAGNLVGELVESRALGHRQGPINERALFVEEPEILPQYLIDDGSDFTDLDDSVDISFSPNSRKRLASDLVQRFPTFSADQKSVNDGCAVCIDGVEINKLMIRLDCDHFYCSECIKEWFEKSSSCPLCRRKYQD